MKRALFLLFTAIPCALYAQSPVIQTLAYSRQMIPGIPPGPGGASATHNPLPTSYFLFVVVKKGTSVSTTGACVQGKWHTATLKRVAAPVEVDEDPGVPTGKKRTLVEKTADDVYRIELQDAQDEACGQHVRGALPQGHDVVVSLQSGGAQWLAAAKAIVALRPAAAP